jgi:hypothetical protein
LSRAIITRSLQVGKKDPTGEYKVMSLLLKENDVSLVNLYAVMRYLCWEKQSWAGLKMLYNLGCAAPFFNLNTGHRT